eukprot:superscaffoldBa00000779_g7158
MSNRDSLGFGDLIPQDVVEIFAQEKHSKRGRKKRSHSLGRALGWLKGKKRKDLRANGQSLGLGPALDLALDGHPAGHQGGHKGGHKSGKQGHPQGNSHAVPKRNDDDKTPAPPSLQENVFIEASRPKYLEDLHTEALEGLKMMQQEETNNGVVYQDNESTISTITVQTDGNGEGFMTDSTIPDTSSVVSVQSSVSTRSSRSGLTRQGSTFRPLNSGRKSEKAKTRRRHRKTVGGIPHHVQRELGLDRAGWTMSSKLEEEQLFNGETDDSTTTDGPQMATESQKGASASLQDMKVIQPLRKHQDEQLCATHAGHRDDLALLHRFGPDLSGGQRPRSLAVPWMTTANSLQQEPPSPVMSMSPQAAYMSKIIPNAVLPPSIEVVEISRGRSRSSLRTVSKTSLLLSSPAPSRASSRASSSRTTSSRASNITSASRYNASHLSDSSCWSNSESSETLVSDSSTISSSSTPRQKRSQDGDASAKEDKVSIHSSISKASKCTSNGKLISKGDKTKNQGPFVRSYSVMKPKRAPPPPNRSYSLYNKMKRRSRDLAEVRIISGESSPRNISASGEENEKNKPGSSPRSLRIIDSPDYNADTSSLDDSTGSFSPFKSQLQALKTEGAAKVEESKDATKEKQEPLQENKLSKMISPSSGYSSQDGTSPQLSKQTHSSSPRHKRGILAKLQRLFPGSTPAGSAPSPLTQPEAPENTKSTDDPSVDTTSASPSTTEVASDTVQAVVSPEFSWPPPPPAMDQVGLSGHDDIDFPIPPPPLFCEERSVVSVVKTEGVKVTTEAETLKTSSSLDIPPPPPYTAPPPPVKAVSPPTTKEVILPPPQEFSPPPPKEVSPLPPKEVSPPPPPKEVSPVMPEESSPPLVQVLPPPVTGVSPTLVNVVSPPLVKEVSPPPVIECSVLPAEEVAPPSCQENAPQSSEEAAPVSKLCPPQTISPPPPIEPVPPLQSQPQSTEQEIDVPLDSIPSKSETNPVSCTSILTPPQSIPPPPPLEFLSPSQVAPSNTDGLETQEASPSLPHEASIPPALETTPSPEANIPLPPPLPVQGLASIEHQPSPASTENQSPEPPSAPAVQEEPTPIVTPSLLQMVKLRSVNSSPEPPKAQEPAQAEVSMRTQQPSNQVPCPSASGEAPQKPIRRSLIMTSPTSTSPPVIITSEPALPKSQSAVVSSASSTTVLSPTKKSPPAMTTSPSMNLQEAIRLRTAARSKDSPASRLSLHSPTSPVGPQKSPSSTASFIFSKSNNKVAIETKPTVETTETSEKNLDVSSVTKGVKMPPPIAKKPKTKAKETETSEGTEQTAGQEAQPESIREEGLYRHTVMSSLQS